MGRKDFSKYLSELGRKGGRARLKKMTAEERREVAIKAGKASGEARKKKAREKKKEQK
jgi:general stress protein YciG